MKTLTLREFEVEDISNLKQTSIISRRSDLNGYILRVRDKYFELTLRHNLSSDLIDIKLTQEINFNKINKEVRITTKMNGGAITKAQYDYFVKMLQSQGIENIKGGIFYYDIEKTNTTSKNIEMEII